MTIPTPVGNDSSVNIDEDQPVTLSLSGVTGSGSPVFEIVIAPQNGSLTKVATNVAGTAGEELWEYVPDTDFSGTDSFVYQVCDNRGTCDVANIEIVVTPQNDAPIPGADEVQANEDQPLTIAISTLTDNDTDVDSDPTFASFSQPENGSISEDAAGNLIYTPDPGFEGIDTFTYTSVDGEHTVTQTVRVVVLATPDSPVAVADVFAGTEDTNLAIAFTELLANDFDPDPADLPAFASYTQPANGTLSTGLTRDLVYTPDANFNGTDTFTYTITDGTNTDTGTVDIELEAVNDSPVAVDDSFSTPEDTAAVLSRASILANDNDVESPLVLDGFTQPANGTLLLDGNDDLVYTPNANFNGVDTFAYTVTDGALVANAEVKIDVESVNDAPIAVDDLVSTDEDTNAAIPLAGLLGNDSDLDSSPTIDSFTQPANGTVTTGLTGDYVYTPKANFNGADTFTYTITDGTATDTATVTIVVTPVNDRPEGEDDLGWSVQQRTTLSILISDLLANDNDPEGEPLTIGTLIGSPDGTTNFSADGLSVEFTSDVEFAGPTTFAYQVCDPQGLCDLSNTQVEINVGNVNDPPVAMLDELPTVNEDQSLTFTAADLLANDDDPDLVHGSESLAVTIDFASVQNGTITSLGADTYRYQPDPNYFGIDDFSYLVTDAAGATSNTGQVKVPVLKVTEAPVAVDDGSNTSQLVTVEVGTTVTLPDLLANDTDDDDAPSALILNVPSQSALGASLSVNTASRVVYQAPTGTIGADTFTYTVTDSDGLTSAPATVHLELKNDLNQAPSGSADVATTLEDQPVTLNWNGPSGLLTNDTDPDLAFGDTLTISSASAPNGGTVSVDAAAETVTYTPAPNFTGPVVFTYIVCDASNACSLPTNVEVTVTDTPDNPIANDDNYVLGGRFETIQGTDLTVSVAEVRTNDFNPDDPTNANGGALTYTLVPDSTGTAPTTVLTTNGSVVTQGSPNAGFVVSPISTYHGEDSFEYQVCNLSGLCDTATVTINIADLNHAPTVSVSVPHGILVPFTGAEDTCLLYTSPSPRDRQKSRMPSSA